jgi:5'-3' exonuclease
MRGRKPVYATDEERAEARRQASQRYRDRKARELEDAKNKILELEAEIELLHEVNDSRGSSGGDVAIEPCTQPTKQCCII